MLSTSQRRINFKSFSGLNKKANKSNSLNWDENHFTNSENIYCYCKKPGVYYEKMLQCHCCLQWFHETCVEALQNPLLFGDLFYSFVCKACNKGQEKLTRIEMHLIDLVCIALNHLAMSSNYCYFSVKNEVVPLICEHLESIVCKDIHVIDAENLIERITLVLRTNPNLFVKSADLWALKMLPTCESFLFGVYYRAKNKAKQSSNRSSTKPKVQRATKRAEKCDDLQMVPETIDEKVLNNASNYAESGYMTSDNNSSSHTSVKGKSLKRCKKLKIMAEEISETLDTLIPFPPNFEGENNPFYD
ncbi:PHD finger protein 1-like isoform X2 [Leptotrombidium deliense]|uniref:PHD finger protein 1-like isoform X2 n=1 Tax=Leptotrombidium deliense TaxID=299467 RepID=A0A443SDV4_9ACAR|nr:PHD finger protein 1-like isoform X2 [Leptotrombidium deliense]